MTYKDAIQEAKEAEKWASVIANGTDEAWIYNLGQTLIHLARSQRELAEQIEKDS